MHVCICFSSRKVWKEEGHPTLTNTTKLNIGFLNRLREKDWNVGRLFTKTEKAIKAPVTFLLLNTKMHVCVCFLVGKFGKTAIKKGGSLILDSLKGLLDTGRQPYTSVVLQGTTDLLSCPGTPDRLTFPRQGSPEKSVEKPNPDPEKTRKKHDFCSRTPKKYDFWPPTPKKLDFWPPNPEKTRFFA